MKSPAKSATLRAREERILVLQGGGALGAYQAGVYEVLAATEQTPEWVAGISIGAINAALIVGNPPERRVRRLREFWDMVTSSSAMLNPPVAPGVPSDPARHAASPGFPDPDPRFRPGRAV